MSGSEITLLKGRRGLGRKGSVIKVLGTGDELEPRAVDRLRAEILINEGRAQWGRRSRPRVKPKQKRKQKAGGRRG